MNSTLVDVLKSGLHNHENVHRHGDDDHDSEDESVVMAKAIAMFVLFCASMFCGIIPFKLAQWFKWTDPANTSNDAKATLVVSTLLSFGGGILLCTTFQHLLPEVNENIEHLVESGHLTDFSFNLGEFLMCMGFFVIYFVDELVHVYIHKHENKKINTDTGAFIRGSSVRHSSLLKRRDSSVKNGSISTTDLIPSDVQVHKCDTNVPAHNQGMHHGHHHHIPPPMDNEGAKLVSSIRGLLIVLALSVHELFEGLAVGLERSPSNVWYMFAAVSAHKFVIAFCVGMELIVARTKFWLALVYVFTFSIVSPIGIGIGILLSNGSSSEDMGIVSVILQGFAAGTLLYVIFFEVLSKERSGLIQYAAVVIGFMVMFGLGFLSMLSPHTH